VLGVAADVDKLAKDVAALEFRRMFSNPLDPNNCFLDIQSGSGGRKRRTGPRCSSACTSSTATARGSLPRCSSTRGEVAGIKSATLKVTGDYAYGHLRTETGVHRL